MCSKTLLIMYRDESAKLCDVFEQRLLLQVDPTHLEESLSKYELVLCLELWFAEESCDEATVSGSLEKVFERQVRVNLSLSRGMHQHFDVFFDYFHLCAVEAAIHAALTNISPSVISLPRLSPASSPTPRIPTQINLAQQSWHSILFRMRSHNSRTQLAFSVHRHLCHALLAARESMLLFWRQILPYLPIHAKPRIEMIDFLGKLEELTATLHALTSDEDLANQLSLDISRLSSQNTVLLRRLCRSIVLQPKVATYLRRQMHQTRMKRFAEAFFCQKLSLVHLLAVYDPNTIGHEALANDVRQSAYFQQLPSLPMSCRELDGDASVLPVIFEDVFIPSVAAAAATNGSGPVHQTAKHLSTSRSRLFSDDDDDPARDFPARGDSTTPNKSKLRKSQSDATSTGTTSGTSDRQSTADLSDTRLERPNTTQTVRNGTLNRINDFSKSTPALVDLDLPRLTVNLPPVLRCIGQNKRRMRRSSSHGRRSVHLIRPNGPSEIPDPVEGNTVRLLGYRSLPVDAEWPRSDCEHQNGFPYDDAPIPRPPLPCKDSAERRQSEPHLFQPHDRHRYGRMIARDLRSRSLHTLTLGGTGEVNHSPQKSTHHTRIVVSPSLHSSPNPSVRGAYNFTPTRSTSSVETDQSRSRRVYRTRSSTITPQVLANHEDTEPLSSFQEYRTKSSTVAVPNGRMTKQSSQVARAHCTRFSWCADVPPSEQIAIGSLSRTPLEPPGGTVPTAHQSNGLDLHPFMQSYCTAVEASISARSHILSSRSMPNLHCAAANASRSGSDAGLPQQCNDGTTRKRSGTVDVGRFTKRTHRMHHSRLTGKQSGTEFSTTVLPDCTTTSRTTIASSTAFRNPTNTYQPYANGRHRQTAPPPVTGITNALRRSLELNGRTQLFHVSQTAESGSLLSTDIDSGVGNSGNNTDPRCRRSSPGSLHSVERDGSPSNSGLKKSRSEDRLLECGYRIVRDDCYAGSSTDEESGDRRSGIEEKMNILELFRAEANRNDRRKTEHTIKGSNEINHKPTLVSRSASLAVAPIPINGTQRELIMRRRRSPSTQPAATFGEQHRSLVDLVSPGVIDYLELKETLKRRLALDFQGQVYSDYPTMASPFAYFSDPDVRSDDLHLIVCVHGLDGNANDLRLVRVYLQLALPDCHLEFLMSECNQQDTFAGFDQMRENLVDELLDFMHDLEETPTRISFVAHSMGCVLVRAALLSPRMQPYLPRLHTFLSLSGPHLGTVYNSSGLVNMGMWMMQKWKKSESLSQLRLRDHTDLRSTYIYRLSASPGLDAFKYLLLVGSPQDRYVPYHSTRIELCKAAVRDTSPLGIIYMEMVTNALQRLMKSPHTTVVRYDVHYSLGSSANNLIGRAAHIAVLDSEVFLEKFVCVSAAKYFR